MPQNRNQVIDRFVGNLANAVLHQILEHAIDNSEIASKYIKEVKTSWDMAKKYRDKINPEDKPLPEKDSDEIKGKVIRKVKAELLIRISKGYEGIDIALVERFVDKSLKELKII